MAKQNAVLKDTRPPNPYVRNIQIAIRVNEQEYEELKKLASRWSEGNVSNWVRVASLKFAPSKSDLN